MIAMSGKSGAILGHKFISNIDEMLNKIVQVNSEGFTFVGEFSRFKISVYNKSVQRKLFQLSGFKCGVLSV